MTPNGMFKIIAVTYVYIRDRFFRHILCVVLVIFYSTFQII